MDRPPPADRPSPPAGGRLLEQIASLITGVHARHLGRGPAKARSYARGDLVVCLLHETMTPAERALHEIGRDDHVRAGRDALGAVMRDELIASVEDLTTRRVLVYLPATSIDPDVTSYLFLLHASLT